jgi:DNA-binding MarR family transcriptional regulator
LAIRSSKTQEENSADRRTQELLILNALRRIWRLLRLSAVEVQAEAGVSAAQLYVLRQLAEDRDGASIGELAEQTLTDRSSVASVVDRLVAAGLAERRVSTGDRRRAEVWITRAGQKLVDRAPSPPTSRLVLGLEALSDAELASLAAGLPALVHGMGLEAIPAAMLFEDPEAEQRPADENGRGSGGNRSSGSNRRPAASKKRRPRR